MGEIEENEEIEKEENVEDEQEAKGQIDEDLYDARTDEILSSEGFRNCPFKDKEDRCYFSKEFGGIKSKCWHVSKCPKGISRV